MEQMILYHTGFQVIREPDIYYGRKNADFGQGFYLSDDRAFSERWAKERRGSTTYFNTYTLTTDDLLIKEFERNEEWFDYIRANRAVKVDSLAEYDVIIGPIANDIIYNVMGITTSGILGREEALKLLLVGPLYKQIVIKTEKAASQLVWQSAEAISHEKIVSFEEIVKAEEEAYQELFAKTMLEIMGE